MVHLFQGGIHFGSRQQQQQQQQNRRNVGRARSLSSRIFRVSASVWLGGMMFTLMLATLCFYIRLALPHFSNGQQQQQHVFDNHGFSFRMLRAAGVADGGSGSDSTVVRTSATTRKRPLILPGWKSVPYGSGVGPLTVVPRNNNNNDNSNRAEDGKKGNRQQSNVVLKAYLEPIDQTSWNVKPLPARATATSDQLTEIRYPNLNACSRLAELWPIDEFPDADPFLPWIHDVFPTHDGKFIQFVAQNKRRCKTGTTDEETKILQHMAPQVALFQHVPVKRIIKTVEGSGTTRYQLVAHEEADPDGIATRFICRFKPSMKETLSTFNVDYEYASFRKEHRRTFSEEGRDNKSIHTSQLIFQCPVPDELIDIVRTGSSVQNDWATLFVDVIPIRTPPRYGVPNQFFPPWYKSQETQMAALKFYPHIEWGEDYILPAIEDSGRWENIPICQPSLMTYERQGNNDTTDVTAPIIIKPVQQEQAVKKHRLVACVWASAGYTTRGHRFAVNDGQRRLLEWIHFHQLVGFDHFYVYDNSGAFSDNNDVSLKPITDMFPNQVTRIPWPAKVCNNNPNNVDSVGERSSQYAAESSCRLRFGPHVEWIGSFDLDEYIVPVGNYSSLLPLLDKLDEEGKKIVSFGSWRAWPRRDLINEPVPITDPKECWSDNSCFDVSVRAGRTTLQAYNCDRHKGQKTQMMPAEKQIYRPDYVKQHFIHYSSVTELTLLNRTEWRNKSNGLPWIKHLSTDPFSRFANEVTEATMLHTKAIARQDTAGWLSACKDSDQGRASCRIGNPWPPGAEEAGVAADSGGWFYNCYVNEKIEDYWVPRLEDEMRMSDHVALLA